MTATGYLPAELEVPGRPTPAATRCTACGVKYRDHSGATCAICSRPAEHHLPGDVELEVEAAARLAGARLAGGLPLRPHDEYALRRHPEHRPPPPEEHHP